MFGKVKIPKHLRPRLKETGAKHGHPDPDAFALHLIEGGLKQFEGVFDPDAKLKARLDAVVDERGYSSRDELVEHLLERGLRAYEEPAESREKLEERLRGLGYIE